MNISQILHIAAEVLGVLYAVAVGTGKVLSYTRFAGGKVSGVLEAVALDAQKLKAVVLVAEGEGEGGDAQK